MTYVWVVTYENRSPAVFYGDNTIDAVLYDDLRTGMIELDDIEHYPDWFNVEDYCTGRLVKVQ